MHTYISIDGQQLVLQVTDLKIRVCNYSPEAERPWGLYCVGDALGKKGFEVLYSSFKSRSSAYRGRKRFIEEINKEIERAYQDILVGNY
jgi:hypothetical protein